MLEPTMGRYLAICVLLWLWPLDSAANAQAPLQIALFKTASTTSELTPLAAALDPVLQAELGRAPEVNVAAVPPLDLASLQLALDCVGETPSCLAVATERSKVSGLLSPSLARSGAALVLSLLLYDPQDGSPLHVVTRSFASDASDATVIAGAKSLVHELFGHAPEPTPAPAPPPAPTIEPLPPLAAADTSAPERAPSLLSPIALGAAGVGVIAIGLGFGVASNSAEARYGRTHIADSADAQHASQLLDTAQTQATIANVAIVLGVASCVAGGVVYFLQRQQRPDTASARVAIGPGYLGVTGGF